MFDLHGKANRCFLFAWMCPLLFIDGQSIAYSQDLSSSAPILQRVFEHAWDQSSVAIGLKSQQFESEAALAAANSWVAGSPTVELSHRFDQSSGAADVGFKESEVLLSSPVWWPAQKSARHALAVFAAEELNAQTLQFRLELASQIREVYWHVAIAQEEVRELDEHVQHLVDIAADVQRRVQVGDLARSDELLANQEAQHAKAQLASSKIELQKRKTDYQNLVGLPAPTMFLVEALALPTTDHPRLVMIRSSLSKAQAALDLANQSRSSAPSIGISLREESTRISASNQALGVHLQIPIGTDVQSKPLQTEAQTRVSTVQAELNRVEAAIKNEVETAKYQLEMEQEALSQATERAASASEHLELIQKAFQLGEKGLIDLLRAQLIRHEASNSKVIQQLKVNWAISKLNQTIGVLP